MTWATVVYMCMGETRALLRAATIEEAKGREHDCLMA